MRYQKSVNVIPEDCSDSGSVHSVEEVLSGNELNSDRANEAVSEAGYEPSGENPENEEIPIKYEVKSVYENAFENDIIDDVIENKNLNLSDSRERDNYSNSKLPKCPIFSADFIQI